MNQLKVEMRAGFHAVRAVVEALPGAYLVLLPDDPSYTILFANSEFARAVLSSPDELTGRRLCDVFPKSSDVLRASLRQVLATKTRSQMDLQRYGIRRSEGHENGHTEIECRPLHLPVFGEDGEDGEVQFILHYAEGITHSGRLAAETGEFRNAGGLENGQTAAESSLEPESVDAVVAGSEDPKRLETRYRFLAESIPQMVWTATSDGMLDYVNRQGTAYFGVPEETLLGAGWLRYVHPEEQASAVERWGQSLATATLYETAFRLKRGSDASWRWHLVRAHPFPGDSGKAVLWFGTCTDIEDQKQAEANLHEQWKTFDTALSYTPDFIYIVDLEGHFIYINQAMASLLNKRREEVIGQSFLDLGHAPELAARLRSQLLEVAHTRQPVRDRAPFTAPGGEIRQYEYIFVPILAADGQVEKIAGSTRDITALSQAAQQIEEDRRRWRELLGQTPAAVAVLRGPDHVFDWINADYAKMVGRSAELLVGKSLREALPELVTQIYPERLDEVYRTGASFIGNESLVRLKSSEGVLHDVYVNVIYLPTRDADGEVNGIFVHATDVTETVTARHKLEESERQFRTLAESISNLAWMADETGSIFWYNRRWYEYTGTTLEEMRGWGWQTVHDPAMLPTVLEAWKKSIATGESFEMIFPLRSARGEFRTFLTRVEPINDNQGRVVRWFGTNTDITDQKKIELELRHANADLQQFAFAAAHDLQEPLRMVTTFTQLLSRQLGGTLDEQTSEYMQQIVGGSKRMSLLLHDLLAYTETSRDRDGERTLVELDTVLSSAVSNLDAAIAENEAIVEAEHLPAVLGNPAHFLQLFQNLIGNAIKYRGVASPRVQVSVEQNGSIWTFRFGDNGMGIPREHRVHVFGVFKRLHGKEIPGTGIGLAICQRVVERHGGHIWVESDGLGQGSTFCFTLPVLREGGA